MAMKEKELAADSELTAVRSFLTSAMGFLLRPLLNLPEQT
jgi:hypothetical protein